MTSHSPAFTAALASMAASPVLRHRDLADVRYEARSWARRFRRLSYGEVLMLMTTRFEPNASRARNAHDLLQTARAFYSICKSQRASQSRYFDRNRMIAAAGIIVALKARIVAAGGLKVEEAA